MCVYACVCVWTIPNAALSPFIMIPAIRWAAVTATGGKVGHSLWDVHPLSEVTISVLKPHREKKRKPILNPQIRLVPASQAVPLGHVGSQPG